jgi:hypothetical protein
VNDNIRVACVFIETRQALWPDGVKFDMLLQVRDDMPYVKKKAAKGLFNEPP